MKKIIFMVSLFWGCSYFNNKNTIPFNKSLSLNVQLDKKLVNDIEVCKYTMENLYRLFTSIDIADSLTDRCMLYIDDIKSKNKKDKDYINYKLRLNLKRLVDDIKQLNAYNDKIRMLVLPKNILVKASDKLKITDNIDIYYLKDTNIKNYDYHVLYEVKRTTISSIVSNIFIASMTVEVINSWSSKIVYSFGLSSLSNISFDDALSKLYKDFESKIFKESDKYIFEYNQIKIYNVKNLSDIIAVVDFLDKLNIKYYVNDFNNNYLDIKILKKDNKNLSEIASKFIRDIKNLSVNNIDEKNGIIVMEFIYTPINII